MMMTLAGSDLLGWPLAVSNAEKLWVRATWISLQHMDFLHAVAGMLVGLLVGLTGVGGGSLMTPMLVLLFGVSPQTAVGTD